MVPMSRVELLRAYAHHPLKMACLPISPHRLLTWFSYGSSGKSAGGVSFTVSVTTVLVILSTPSDLPEK